MEDGGYLRFWDVAAVVEGYDLEMGRLLCRQRNKFSVGDVLEALIPGGRVLPVPVPALFDANGVSIPDTPHPTMEFQLPFGEALPKGTMLRQRRSEEAGGFRE